MQKIVLIAILLCVSMSNLTSESQDRSDYETWKLTHGVSFSEDQDRYRHFLFKQAQSRVKAHNQNPEHSWKKGLNQFSAFTYEENANQYLGALPPQEQVQIDLEEDSSESDEEDSEESTDDSENPTIGDEGEDHPIVGITAKNWTAEGKVTAVRSQGGCGSCWAFATVGILEAKSLIQKNQMVDLSEQQLVDCVYSSRSGCKGGWMSTALNHILAQGIATEAAYPYIKSYQGCRSSPVRSFSIASYGRSPRKKCGAMRRKILNKGPGSVALQVDNQWWDYDSGVLKCDTSKITKLNQINHAVLAVGYTSRGHWIFKNSWGTRWGINGYAVLHKGNKHVVETDGTITILKAWNCNVCYYGIDYAQL